MTLRAGNRLAMGGGWNPSALRGAALSQPPALARVLDTSKAGIKAQ